MTARRAPSRAPRRRPPRGAAESLGAIVLGFESVVVFLAGLVVFGLKALPAGVADWWGIVGGAVLGIAMILTARFTGTRGGIVVGWLLQAILIAAGLLVPAIAVAGVLFGAMWAYATIKGASLDRRNAALRRAAEAADTERSTPDPTNPEPPNGTPT